uniref:Uncharacterized protein LOC111103468 n=1 Tax=Crassostrea virginica TaxID=6565 RepID=A0A8B8AN32_CRAVI|nr:uncharacterized protein LOC111103468 [Crassostrea virginica]
MLNALSAGQEEGSTPMNSKPMPQKAVTEIALLVVLMLTTVICAAVVVVVIIFYLRCWHRKGGDKIADAEKNPKPNKANSGIQVELTGSVITDREAETVLNGAKDQLREVQNLSKKFALSVREFKSLERHATSILKFIEDGIYEENEPLTMKEELLAEVNKRESEVSQSPEAAKDPKENSDDNDDGTHRKRSMESNQERQNRLYTETNKILNEGIKFIEEAKQSDIEIYNFTKDAKKGLVQVKERMRTMKEPEIKPRRSEFTDTCTYTKKDGKQGNDGAGEEG